MMFLGCGFFTGFNVGFYILFATQGVTAIKFLTDGVLLREMMDDPLLMKYRYLFADVATVYDLLSLQVENHHHFCLLLFQRYNG